MAFGLQDAATELFRAIREGGGVARIRSILETDKSLVKSRGDLDVTPLHEASRYSNVDVVRLLIERGADVNSVCYNDLTPLYFAASEGKVDIVKCLIEKGANVEARTKAGTPLQSASEHGQHNVVRELLRAGAVYDILSAIFLSDTSQVKVLLTNDPKCAKRENLLHEACRLGCEEIVKVLLANGADPNDYRRPFGDPPLLLSLKHPSIVKLLLERGADPSIRLRVKGLPAGATLLHQAAKGPVESARLLMERGVDVNAQLVDPRRPSITHSITPLQISASAGSPEMVRFLLENGADPKIQSPDGRNSLQLAAAGIRPIDGEQQSLDNSRKCEIVQILSGSGLSVDLHSAIAINDLGRAKIILADSRERANEKDTESNTPLQRAVQLSRVEIVRVLLAAGADINGPGRSGNTPLHEAAFWGLPALVRLLIDHQARCNSKNDAGLSPLAEAERVQEYANDKKPFLEIVKMLREAQGK